MTDISSLADKVTGGFQAGDMFTNILNSQIWNKVLFWGEIIVIGFLLSMGAAWIYKKYLPFKLKINIYKRIGSGAYEIIRDKGKYTVDEHGKHKIELMKLKKGKRKCTFPIPSQEFRVKQGRKDVFNVFLDDNQELHPIKIPIVAQGFEQYLKIMPQEREAWARSEERILLNKTQKKENWEKWLPSVVWLATLFAGVLICFFLFKNIGSGMSELADTFRQIASSCASLG